MPPLINAQEISKTFGVTQLFKNISFTVSEADRIGLIGPNGAGKSTLLQILEGRLKPDTGHIAVRKRTRVSYVGQEPAFAAGQTVRSVVELAMRQSAVPEADHQSTMAETLGRAGFTALEADAASLSGGWRKRLAIVEGLVRLPDVLFLDEPTNHLDLAGIRWLEGVLQAGTFAAVVVSHDRYLLEHVAGEVVELNRTYEEGLLRVKGNYSVFLQARDDYARAQGKLQETLSNRVRNEIEWLRRGPKARATKAKARIETAMEMIRELADVNARNRVNTAGIDFTATDRSTKQLIELDKVEYAIDGQTLFSGVGLMIQPGMRVGLVGPNGSGKTTLLRLIRGDIQPGHGRVRRADQLRIVYFDQNRDLDPDITLKRTLAPDSDSVVYQDRVIHVASWAARFLFSSDALNQPVGRLSGGERARVLIAQLMLQPADVMLLDEPTNDLDIPTLEVLEDSLMDFPGAFVLVTHDRYLMDRVSTLVLGLDGMGHAERFADVSQWEAWQQAQEAMLTEAAPARSAPRVPVASQTRKKLSYIEAREFAGLEQQLIRAEETLLAKHAKLQDPAIASDGPGLLAASAEVEAAKAMVDQLYSRWAELDEKQG
ncbi:MAG TPA: ABC-F family ATP-binding cassette domain-containing protein [Terriglobia bacterium]|nr:ABC-F family ATP-binding cassette domain-containing protein [Terriglobia bacterium]